MQDFLRASSEEVIPLLNSLIDQKNSRPWKYAENEVENALSRSNIAQAILQGKSLKEVTASIDNILVERERQKQLQEEKRKQKQLQEEKESKAFVVFVTSSGVIILTGIILLVLLGANEIFDLL